MFLVRWISCATLAFLGTPAISMAANYQFQCAVLQGTTLPLPSSLYTENKDVRKTYEWVADGHDKFYSGLQISIDASAKSARIQYLDRHGRLESSHEMGNLSDLTTGDEFSQARIDVKSGRATTETYLVSWDRSQTGRVVFVQIRPESIARNVSVFQAGCRTN